MTVRKNYSPQQGSKQCAWSGCLAASAIANTSSWKAVNWWPSSLALSKVNSYTRLTWSSLWAFGAGQSSSLWRYADLIDREHHFWCREHSSHPRNSSNQYFPLYYCISLHVCNVLEYPVIICPATGPFCLGNTYLKMTVPWGTSWVSETHQHF